MDNPNEQLYKIMQLTIPPPGPGTRIIVSGWEDYEVEVSGFEFVSSENRIKIHLDWGKLGVSHVYGHDEGTIWRRFLDVN
ncbi:hypothetical protein LCGC14_0701970 [marine sediment metagenome]|uniref:Uncharacterized protein n=1 Tax=marine sediment metagenome TaxID=412755 RepID=A0A0F9QHI2_9ZZZZ